MNNKFTIVYKTYDNDLVWFKYSLLSVNKFVFNISEIIIYYHDSCEKKIIEILSENNFIIPYRIIPIKYDFHGYLKQMVVKSMCFNDVKTEYVVFVDSDVIFTKPYTPEFGLKNDKIIWKIQIKDKKNQFNNFSYYSS